MPTIKQTIQTSLKGEHTQKEILIVDDSDKNL